MDSRHNLDVDTPSSLPSGGDSNRLDRVEDAIKQINVRLDRDLKVTGGESEAVSRFAVASTFAAIGAKIGGLIGAAVPIFQQGGSLKDLFKGKKTDAEETGVVFKVGIWSGIGAAVGGAVLGAVGWVRGNRVEKASYLLTRPWDSIQRIVGMKPSALEEKGIKPTPASAPTLEDANAILQASLQGGTWAHQIASEKAITTSQSLAR